MTEPLVDVGNYREQLGDKLESLAAWRKREAAEHPDDERNAQSAEALRAAASDVLALKDDDPRLRGLATVCQAHNDDERISYIEAEDQIVSHYGFGAGAALGIDELLGALAKAAEDAAKRA
jgi:hypothetical protein